MKAMRGADPEGFYKAYERAETRLNGEMLDIARKMAAKKWGSYEMYRHENRKAQIDVIHRWYGRNAEKYGYRYRFEEAGKEDGKA